MQLHRDGKLRWSRSAQPPCPAPPHTVGEPGHSREREERQQRRKGESSKRGGQQGGDGWHEEGARRAAGVQQLFRPVSKRHAACEGRWLYRSQWGTCHQQQVRFRCNQVHPPTTSWSLFNALPCQARDNTHLSSWRR